MTEIITKIEVLKVSLVLRPLMLYLDFGYLGEDCVSRTICFGWKTKPSHVSAFEHIMVFTRGAPFALHGIYKRRVDNTRQTC